MYRAVLCVVCRGFLSAEKIKFFKSHLTLMLTFDSTRKMVIITM